MVEEDIEFITFDGDTLTKSEFRDEIITKYRTAELDGLTKITDFSIGSEAYHLADVIASYILEHRELIDLNYRMSMIHTAEGEFLDNFGDMVGVHRVGSSASTGEVTFTRLSEDTSLDILIPDGTQVSTIDAISFVVDNDGEDLVIGAGATSVTANVLCELEGAYTNVDPNTIVLVMGDLGSLVSVTNTAKMVDGEDIESDDEYRARILLSPYAVPTGSLEWYENVAITPTDTEGNNIIHDVKVERGVVGLDADVKMYYNPADWTDTTIAKTSLEELFAMKEYDIVGITIEYILATRVTVLPATSSEGAYKIALILEDNYSLEMVKDDVVAKVEQFNRDANISIEFSPSSLASIIENEIDGIQVCHIVLQNGSSYTEVIEQTDMADDEVYHIDMTDLEERIIEARFNLDIEIVEG